MSEANFTFNGHEKAFYGVFFVLFIQSALLNRSRSQGQNYALGSNIEPSFARNVFFFLSTLTVEIIVQVLLLRCYFLYYQSTNLLSIEKLSCIITILAHYIINNTNILWNSFGHQKINNTGYLICCIVFPWYFLLLW